LAQIGTATWFDADDSGDLWVALLYDVYFIAGTIILTAIAVRLLFLFNYACRGEDLNFSLAWRQTRGNSWRILWALCAILIPPYVPYVIVSWDVPMFGEAVDLADPAVIVSMVLYSLSMMLAAVLAAALGTTAYAFLTGYSLPTD